MFKAVVLIIAALSGEPRGVATSLATFDTKDACTAVLDKYVAATQAAHPGDKLMAACLDKATLDKLLAEDKPGDAI